MDQVFYLQASAYSRWEYLFAFYDCSLNAGFVTTENAKTTHGGGFANLHIDIDGTEYFLIASTVPT